MRRVPITQKSWDALVPGTLIKSTKYKHWWEYVGAYRGERKLFVFHPNGAVDDTYQFRVEDFGPSRGLGGWEIWLPHKRRIV